MPSNKLIQKYTLSELIDINLLQDLQDSLAKILNIASITVDKEGPVTNPSNFSEFCIKYTRSTTEGLTRCNNCDLIHGKIAAKQGKPFIYKCHAGLTDFAVPIIVEGRHLGTIMGGQLLTEEPDEEMFRQTAREIGVNEDEYIASLKKIPIISTEKIEATVKLLSSVANSLSQMAYKKFQLAQRNTRKSVVAKVSAKIRSSLDLDEVFDLICKELASTFNVQRTFIVQFSDKNGKSEFKVRKEFRSSPEVKGLSYAKFDVRTVEYWGKLLLKEGKRIIIDSIQEADVPDYFKETYGSIGEKATVGIPIKKGNDAWGWVGIGEYNYNRHWTEEEISLLETISGQIYVALRQAELYTITKDQVKRESLLREIVETIRSSLDVSKTKKTIVEKVGKLLDADRCFIVDFDKETNRFAPVEDEYLSSSNVKSLIGMDLNMLVPNFSEALKQGKPILIDQNKAFIGEESINNHEEKNAIEMYKTTSGFALPLFYYNEMIGAISIHYTDNRGLVTESEISFLTMIANQVAIAIHQSKLHLQTTEFAKRELLLRKIISIISSTLDLEQIKSHIVNQVGKTLNADRVFFADYDNKSEKYKVTPAAEYRSSTSLQSVQGFDFTLVPGFVKNIKNLHVQGKDVIYENLLEHYEKGLNSDTDAMVDFFQNNGFMSLLAINIKYRNKYFGNLVVSFSNKTKISKEDIHFVKTIANQAGVVIQQSSLLKITKQQANKERLYRLIIETIRSSLDLQETNQRIVDIIGKTLSADRCFIAEYDSISEKFMPVQNEYLANDTILSYKGSNPSDNAPNFAEQVKNGKSLLVNNKNISDLSEGQDFEMEKRTIEKYSIDSFYGAPFFYQKKLLGALVVHYIREHYIEADEIKLIDTLADQVAIAVHQAKQFMKEQKSAEREFLLRKGIETIRSFIDINETLTIICDEVAKIFDVQRATIVEVPDLNNTSVWKIRREFKSREDIIGMEDIDYDKRTGEYNGDIILKGAPFVINDVQKADLPDYYKETYTKMGVKSILSVTIQSGKEKFGQIFLSSVDKYRAWSEDEVSLLEGIASQIYVAIKQAELYETQKKTAERETLLRKITEKMRSSLSIEETLDFICVETAQLFNVQRAAVAQFLNPKDLREYIIRKEYLASPNLNGYPNSEDSADAAAYWAKKVLEEDEILAIDDVNADNTPDSFKKTYGKMGVKSLIGTGIRKRNDVIGTLVLSEYFTYRKWSEEDKKILKTVSDQVYIAINQAELFEKERKTAQREKLLKDIVVAIRKSLDINEVKKDVVTEICKAFNADRCYFRNYDKVNSKFLAADTEYLKSPDLIHLDAEVPDQEALVYFFEQLKRNQNGFYPIVVNEEKAKGTPLERYFSRAGIKADYAMPMVDRDDELNYLVLHYSKEDPKLGEEDKIFLETVAEQIVIALEHAKLYKTVQLNAERSKLIGNILSSVIKSFDIKEMQEIVKEIGIITKADRCYFLEVNIEKSQGKPIGENGEYLASEDIPSVLGYDSNETNTKPFLDLFITQKDLIVFDYEKPLNQYDPIIRDYASNFGLKSAIGIPFFYMNKLSAVLAIEYVKNKVIPTADQLEFLRILGNQVGMVYKQIKLYLDTKKTAEIEKFNRSILEILRTSLDKQIIKHLFVKNIGKYFKADRVFFSDYNERNKMYLPVEEGAEYLSSPQEKSFVGYDWSDSTIREYIQPLLDKRELKIECWDSYIKNNPKTPEFIELFVDADVRSSYNFPVTYQERIMGYFCIEFTKDNCEVLPPEDISRIRNICSQAGVSLYQAELFEKYQKSAQFKENIISSISKEFKEPLDQIIEDADILYKSDLDRGGQIKYLNNINQNSKQLNELRNDIIHISEIESENFALNIQDVNTTDIIENVIENLIISDSYKNIKMKLKLSNIIVKADKNRFYQIIYDLLSNAINYLPPNSNLTIKTILENKNLVVLIEIPGEGLDSDAKNKIFEVFKRIDLSYVGGRKGLGLGLFLVKRLIELHEGTLHVDSTEDSGTVVSLIIPNATLYETENENINFN